MSRKSRLTVKESFVRDFGGPVVKQSHFQIEEDSPFFRLDWTFIVSSMTVI